jgi:lipopolysaccharide assembly outer membrane protein LptD (OstA)
MRSLPPVFLLVASCCAYSVAAAEDSTTLSATNLLAGSSLTPAANASASPDVEITNLSPQSELEYSSDEAIWYGRRGVRVTYNGMEMVANQIAMSEQTGGIIADGNVRLKNGAMYWIGDHLEYNYKTGEMSSDHFRAGKSPFFSEGFELSGHTQEQTYSLHDAYVTSDDLKDPDFRIQAREFKVVMGKYISAKGATLYLGHTPVMYLPYYKRDLTSHRTFWKVVPGYRSLYGAYLLNSYHFPITTNFTGALNLDLYQKRGLGVGPDFSWNNTPLGDGEFSGWYIHDGDPDRDRFTQKPIDGQRHRISFSDRATLRTNLTAKVVVREQSDAFVVRDFFETEYRKNSEPRSFLEVNQLWSNWSLDLMAQPQINSFFQTVERLPDIKLSGLRQQIGETPLYYESDSSLGYLRFRSGLDNLPEYAALRADSFHQVLWPQTYFGWLNFVPRVGGRFTEYGETEGTGTTFDDRSRFVFNTGAETSFKASRVWPGLQNKFFEVDGLRHIIEPSMNYVFVPEPNYRPRELPQFDTEIPSLRLLPIDFPDYNAVDSIDTQNVIRFGLHNKLQTKREGGVQNLLNWSIYTDWRLDPRSDQTTFSDVYSDLDLRPRSWLTLNSQLRYDVHTDEWNAAYHTLTITPNDTWSLQLGHMYFRGGPEFGVDSDNNTIFSSIYYKLNENWGARVSHHFEARDGVLEEQYYTIYRDFRSWTGALTVRLRDNRDRGNDFTIAFTFNLKAYPRFKLGEDRDEPTFLLGS